MTDTEKIDLLDRYSRWLESHGYLDTDWWFEDPKAIDEFMKDERKTIQTEKERIKAMEAKL